LLASPSPVAPGPSPAAAPGQGADLLVFEGDGVTIRFSCRAAPAPPGGTDVIATCSNSGLDDITDFNLQVRAALEAMSNSLTAASAAAAISVYK
jgi:hypothetical protein